MTIHKQYGVVSTKQDVEKLAGTRVLFPWDEDFDWDPRDVSASVKFEYRGEEAWMWVPGSVADAKSVDAGESVMWSVWSEGSGKALSITVQLQQSGKQQ